MSDTQAILRRTGRAAAVVAGGVMALGAVAGTASAEPAQLDALPPGDQALGAPVDGFVHHWGELHYHNSFTQNDLRYATANPADYTKLHVELVEEMAGLKKSPDTFMIGEGYPKV
jgi:hypothetical protein